MASPAVEGGWTVSSSATDANTHVITMPASIVAGRTLLAVCSIDGVNTAPTAPGWTYKGGGASGSQSQRIAVFARIATGDDTMTLTLPTGVSETHATAVTQLSGAADPSRIYLGIAAATADPPSLSPTPGSADYLWVAAVAGASGSPSTSAPTDFSAVTSAASGTAAADSWLAVASREFTGASLDPAAFSGGGGANGMAATIAVFPATNYAGAAQIDATGAVVAGAWQGHQGAVTLAGGGDLTAGAVRVRPAVAALDGTGDLAATATRVHAAAATLEGGSSVTATALEALLTGGGDLTADARRVQPAAATLAGGGDLVATALATYRVTATLAGGGDLAAGGTRVRPADTALAGGGGLVATGIRIRPAQAVLVGGGTLTTTGIRIRPSAAALAAAGTLIASARVAAGGQLNPSLWAVDRTTGALTPLPHYTKLTISPVRNSPGKVAVEYPVYGRGFELLAANVDEDRDLEVEIWLSGRRTGALRGILTDTSGDDVAEDAVWSFDGCFLEVLLDEVLIYPQPRADKQELVFSGKNAGEMAATVLQQAQSRGGLAGVTRDFTTTLDSTGAAWDRTVNIKFSPGATLLEMLQELVDLGMIDAFELTAGRVLRLWAPGRYGVDRTVGASPVTFRRGRNLSESPRRHTVRSSGTTALVAGSEGLYRDLTDATALARRGRRVEIATSANGLSDVVALDAYLQTYMQTITPGTMEVAHGLALGPGHPRPFVHFDRGDWAWSDTRGRLEKLRVYQLTLTVSGPGIFDGDVVLGTPVTDRLLALARRLKRISSGAEVVGTSAPPSTDDTVPPAAPTGVTVDSIASLQGAETVATLLVGWTAVTTNASGPQSPKARAAQLILERMQSGAGILEDWTWFEAPAVVGAWNDQLLADFEASGSSDAQTWLAAYVADNSETGTAADDIAGYRVEFTYASEPNAWTLGVDKAGQATESASFGPVTAGVAVRVRVFAYDRTGNVSAPSAVVEVVTETDTAAPPTPSTPILTSRLGVILAEWDGYGSAGQVMPIDLDFVEVHVSAANNFTPTSATYYDRISPGGGTMPITDRPYGAVTYVRFVAVDKTYPTPNRSGPSATASDTAEQVVNPDIFDGAVGTSKLADLVVTTAKINNLAVNDAKIGDLSVGKLTAGVFSAAMTISGIIRTATTGRRMEIDGNGWRSYNAGSTLWAELNVTTETMLVTGTIQTGLTGARIRILPDGTQRFYGSTGTDYAEIYNDSAVLRFRSRADGSGRRSYVNFDPTGFQATYTDPGGNISQFDLGLTYGVINSPVPGIRIWRQYAPGDGTQNRFHFVMASDTGDDANSVIHYYGRRAGWTANTITDNVGVFRNAVHANGILMGGSSVAILGNRDDVYGPFTADGFSTPSSGVLKSAPAELAPRVGGSARRVLREAPARAWFYRHDLEPWPERPGVLVQRIDPDTGEAAMVDAEWAREQPAPRMHFGPIAEDLAQVSPLLVHHDDQGHLMTDIRDLLGVLWGAGGELDAALAQLAVRVDALERGRPAPVTIVREG